MRRSEIVVTTPKKSIIYAFGSATDENKMMAKDSPNILQMAYVLENEPKKTLVVLRRVGDGYSHDLQRNVTEAEVATPLEALKYRVEDAYKRWAALSEFSHWHVSGEEKIKRDKMLAELKPVPLGWVIERADPRKIRFLWAEFDVAKERYQERKAAERKLTEEAAAAARARRLKLAERAHRLGITGEINVNHRDQGGKDFNLNWYGFGASLSPVNVERILNWLEDLAARNGGKLPEFGIEATDADD